MLQKFKSEKKKYKRVYSNYKNKFKDYRIKETDINNIVDCPVIKEYKCSICIPYRFYKSSSSFDKHLRKAHSNEWA